LHSPELISRVCNRRIHLEHGVITNDDIIERKLMEGDGENKKL